MAKNSEIISSVIEQLYRITNKIGRLEKDPVDFGTGERLTPSEIHMLDAIAKGKGNTVSELCEHFGITRGAVSQVIGKMEGKGYLDKARSGDYYKEIILSLTDKGEAAVKGHAAFHKKMDKHFCGILEDISPDEIDNFKRVLGRIGDGMEHYLKGR